MLLNGKGAEPFQRLGVRSILGGRPEVIGRRSKRSGRALQEVFVGLVVSGLASMYPVSSWSCFAPDHHGYQRACVLITGQASIGPFGSPVFACAGKTDPPSLLIPLADLGWKRLIGLRHRLLLLISPSPERDRLQPGHDRGDCQAPRASRLRSISRRNRRRDAMRGILSMEARSRTKQHLNGNRARLVKRNNSQVRVHYRAA
jgi:hypothetical protein